MATTCSGQLFLLLCCILDIMGYALYIDFLQNSHRLSVLFLVVAERRRKNENGGKTKMRNKSKIQEKERKFYLSEFSYFDGEYGKFYESKISLGEFEEVD